MFSFDFSHINRNEVQHRTATATNDLKKESAKRIAIDLNVTTIKGKQIIIRATNQCREVQHFKNKGLMAAWPSG